MARGSFPLGNPFSGGAGVRLPGGGPGPADPSQSMDPNSINATLQPYGVQLPTSYQQPGIAENTGWGQRHPGIATGIDNALIAVAGMGPTGDTAGENISNVARGVMGIGPYRRQYASEQAMVPFQIAKEVGGLQAQQSYMQMQKAMAGYYGDRGQAALAKNQIDLQKAQLRTEMERMKEPMLMDAPDPQNPGKTIKAVGFAKYNDDLTDFKYVPDYSLDAQGFMQKQRMDKLSGTFGVGTGKDGAVIWAQMAKELGKNIGDVEPDMSKWGPKERDAFLSASDYAAKHTTSYYDALLRRPNDPGGYSKQAMIADREWDPLESTCRHASLSIL